MLTCVTLTKWLLQGYGSGATSVGGGGYDSSSIGSLGGVRGYTSLQQAQQAQQHRSQAMPFSAGGVGFGQQGMLIPQMPIGGMAKNPFHDKIDFVLPETAVIAGLRSHGPQTTFTHTITITGEHLSKLNTPGLWGAAKFSAFLRCCYYNTKKKTWIDSWPRGVMFSLGGRPLRDDLIRPPRFRPTDITTELQQAARASAHSATAAIQCNFQITQAAAVTGANQNMANYVVSIFCASSSTPTSLTDRLRSSISPAEKCQQQIAEKLREQQVDADICVGRTFVSLKCPLSQCRISLPCKPSTCSHLQCFDLAFFLKMNERKPTWECPVCRGPAQFSTLEINGLFVKILAEAPTNAVDVEFDDSANWTYRSHEEKEKEEQATTEQRNAKRRRSSQALQGSSGVAAAGSTTGYSSGGGGGGGGGAAAASSSGARANSTVETGSSLDSLLNGSDAFFNDLIFGHGVARIEGSTGAGAAAGAAGAGTQDQPICLD